MPGMTLSSTRRAIFCASVALLTMNGISVTTIRMQFLRFGSSSMSQIERIFTVPRPVV